MLLLLLTPWMLLLPRLMLLLMLLLLLLLLLVLLPYDNRNGNIYTTATPSILVEEYAVGRAGEWSLKHP